MKNSNKNLCPICNKDISKEPCGCLYNPFPELDKVKIEIPEGEGWKSNKEDKYNKS